MPRLSVYIKDPQLLATLDKKINARKLAGDSTSRNSVLNNLIRDYVNADTTEEIELPAVEVKAKTRLFLTVPKRFAWLPQTLTKVVAIKEKAGKTSSVQQEILLLAVHGFLSDPTYGKVLRDLLNDSR